MHALSPTRGLIIAGHGSLKNAGSRAPICAAVQAIRARTLYDEIRCALWKEEPHFSRILPQMRSTTITIVPFFMSDGYYTRQVIPREMELDGPVTRRDGRTLYYARSIGDHPLLADVIIQRAHEAGALPGDTLAVLGHGTPRNPTSDANIFLQADRVRSKNMFADVITVFIDQEPNLLNIHTLTAASRIVLVPLFAAAGWHVTETIPADLGIADGRTFWHEREIIYAEPVGTSPLLIDILLERALEAEVDPNAAHR